MISQAWETINLAISALRTNDMPAVVFYDTVQAAVIAESVNRFYMRPDHKDNERYQVILRVSEELFELLPLLARTAPVVDIRPGASTDRAFRAPGPT